MQEGRANNFDALRLMGALLVFYSHQFTLTQYPVPVVTAVDASFGMLGLYLFFSISGYLVCQSWIRDPDAYRFVRRRFLRIWPGMAAAIVISSVVLFAFMPVSVWALVGYLMNLVCISCNRGVYFFPGNAFSTINGSLWTISLEVQCYGVLLAAGMLAGRRLGALIGGMAVLAMLMWMMRRFMPLEMLMELAAHGWVYPSLGEYGALFLAGCLLCFHRQLIDRAWLPVLGGVLLILRDEPVLGLIVALPPAVVWIGTRSWPVLRSAGRFGDLSYGIYLWAWPVQQTMVMWFGRSLPFWALFALTLAITAAFAFASWHLVEKRALRLKPRKPPVSATNHPADAAQILR